MFHKVLLYVCYNIVQDLQSNGILQTNSTGNPIDASNQQNLTEIQRQLLAVDASERVLNATTTLLAASRCKLSSELFLP